MTPEQFVYWMQGFAELNPEPPTAEQWQAIRGHLDLVFIKVTPVYEPFTSPSINPEPWIGPTWTGTPTLYCQSIGGGSSS